MQIVIDIYETLKNLADEFDVITLSQPAWQSIMIDAIRNGTVLPDNHGDLIDSNIDVSKYIEVWECNCSKYSTQTVMAVDDLKYLPTILEGNKED